MYACPPGAAKAGKGYFCFLLFCLLLASFFTGKGEANATGFIAWKSRARYFTGIVRNLVL
ncbi:hypothetical protein C1N53_20725 [Pontibacter sp. SGAir0037]|nr:hypothetical protein C1N53_20725 [Pontibacter sp. SGAir0037]